jgi:hypothetical protein
MKETDDDMASMIVAEFPQARAALAVMQALHGHLPIKSSKHLVEVLEDKPAKVMGARIGGKMIAGLVPDDLFPISDAKTLARFSAIAVRSGAQTLVQRGTEIEDKAIRELAVELAPQGAVSGAVGLGWLGNDSLFGFKRATDGKEK